MNVMSDNAKNIISCDAANGAVTLDSVGGKAWNLFRLRKLGYPVPPLFVVLSRVLSEVLGSKKEAIEQIVSSAKENGSLESASNEIREIIAAGRLPESFLDELSTVLEGSESLFSVRSSVVDEDSAGSSFAGQMDSFLNVPPSEIALRVKDVWASAFSSRALLYRRQKKLSFKNISVAVIIQRMVQAESSGVMFTRDPETHAKRCIISAGYGLGEGVVANLVETDTYTTDWNSNEIVRDVRQKDQRVVLNANRQAGTHLERISADLQATQVLGDEQISLLCERGQRIESDFGSPQDIEWAFDNHGSLWILQARPIVFPATRSNVRVWDNSNIVESYPGLTLPLTFTFVRGAYERAFCNAAYQFFAFKSSLKKSQHIFRNMIGLLDGRVYYNLLNWYEMLSYLPGFQQHKKSWDLMIGISQKIEFPKNEISLVNRISSFILTIWRLLTVKRNAKRFFRHFWPLYRRFTSQDISAFSEDELIRLYRNLEEGFHTVWHLTLVNDFCAMKYYDWLKTLCSGWRIGNHANLHNDLLCGESGVESVAPVRSLVQLAQLVRSNEDYRSMLSSQDTSQAWEVIQKESRYAELKEAFEGHLDKFGDRGLEELKLETTTFRDNPAQLLYLVKNHVSLDMTVEMMELQEQAVRSQAEQSVQLHITNPLQRILFRFVLHKARFAVKTRENMRFARTRVHGIARRLFRRMGDLFVQKGLIKSSRDIYYLTLEEILGIVEGTATTQNLQGLVEIRKKEYEAFARRQLKERIETWDIPYLGSFQKHESFDANGKMLKGIGCSSGLARGKAAIVLDPKKYKESGDRILVARSTDPGWVFLMISSKGIIVEKGSVLSHTAIIGRELGIPTIVGATDATKRIQDGAEITMDGSTGVIQWQ
ncbi:MAG: hypothetical protein HY562_04610 [Ignavibacteriales bacterium]|nr:hypothetical protein [Ignavibacteriales bacterium]